MQQLLQLIIVVAAIACGNEPRVTPIAIPVSARFALADSTTPTPAMVDDLFATFEPACSGSADCGGFGTCKSGTCGHCTTTADCSGHGQCKNNRCNGCSASSDCKVGSCKAGRCGGCSASSDCNGDGQCGDGRCGACAHSSDCNLGTCKAKRCGGCSTSSDCKGGTCRDGRCSNYPAT